MDFMIMMPLGPQLMRIFEINPQQFSLLVASYTVTAGVAGFFAAFLIDRFDRKRALIFIYTGFAIGTLACAFAPTYGFLLITRSLTGGFGGVLGALILSIVSDIVPLSRRAKGIGTVMASFGLASVLGVPFGLFIASKSSWHAPFLLLGILAFIIDFFIVAYIPSMKGHLKEKHAGPWEVLSNIFGKANARLGLTFTSTLMLGHFTIIPFIAPYMVGNVGFTEDQLALIYLVGGMCTIFFSPWVGKMADKHGRVKIFTIFGTLVIIPILIITNLSPVPVWIVLLISAIFFIFSNGRMVPSTTMETAIIKPENRGSYMSIRSSVQQLTSGLASFVAGLIIVERAPIFGQAKALANFNYVGGIAVIFSIISLFIARKLSVEQGA
jgi:predicted MFS family arabinose efflux permease